MAFRYSLRLNSKTFRGSPFQFALKASGYSNSPSPVVVISDKRLLSFIDFFSTRTRPLRSTAITPLPRYYGPLRLPVLPRLGYGFPRQVRGTTSKHGASQVPVPSVATRHPQTPRGTRQYASAEQRPPVLASTRHKSLAAPGLITLGVDSRVRLRYGSRLRLRRASKRPSRNAPPARLHVFSFLHGELLSFH